MIDKPRIFVAYTGGTIGMKKTSGGYAPARGHLQQLMEKFPQFKAPQVPEYHIHQFPKLLDSSDMTPANWLEIASVIRRHYDEFDGFLILHGTDTMAFTASALSFMLEDLAKPVIVTGSQIPLEEVRNDALENLLTSLMILGEYHDRLADVLLYFDNKLFRGNRTTKVDADAFSAFASPNFPPVGEVGIHVEIDWELVRRPEAPTGRQLQVVEIGEATVGVFRLFPGMRARYMAALLAHPVQGIVLECYGAGNAPHRNVPFMAALSEACDRGVVIVDVTQPLHGTADLSLYATGRSLLDIGVVSGHDMTTEAALAKLFYLFAKGQPRDEVRRLVSENLRGELTSPEERPLVEEKLRRHTYRHQAPAG